MLVDSSGKIRLSDFGCALVISNEMNSTDRVSAIKGTIPWMAPEVIKQQGYTLKADIWSLGCTVIEMAIAGNPWGMTIKGYLDDILKLTNQNIRPTIPNMLSKSCQDFIDKCIQRDPKLRPTCFELLQHEFILSNE